MGPPILPRPMKAIFMVSNSIGEAKLILAQRREQRFDILHFDVFEARRTPLRLTVLVDDQRPHPFTEITQVDGAMGITIFVIEALFHSVEAARLADREMRCGECDRRMDLDL